MQHSFIIQSATRFVNPTSNSQAKAYTYSPISLFIISFPILLLLGVTAYKKYRTVIFQRQIATLEKIWLKTIQ
ncbi:hypothetical protein [Fischerella sp. PCC 9605]|uniref:hypothetical protein n=1 Tax=Fischerella sp. PCC 9605 TaxID=1173024 RepID=UPI00047DEFC3|nr:hypothetical protein [Fischerella sp. PCC 9605]